MSNITLLLFWHFAQRKLMCYFSLVHLNVWPSFCFIKNILVCLLTSGGRFPTATNSFPCFSLVTWCKEGVIAQIEQNYNFVSYLSKRIMFAQCFDLVWALHHVCQIKLEHPEFDCLTPFKCDMTFPFQEKVLIIKNREESHFSRSSRTHFCDALANF